MAVPTTQIQSQVLEDVSKELVVNVFLKASPVYAKLMAQGNVKGKDGGQNIQHRIKYSRAVASGTWIDSTTEDNEVTPTFTQYITRTTWPWKFVVYSMKDNIIKRVLARGRNALGNAIAEDLESLREGFTKDMGDELYQDGTTGTTEDAHITGLVSAVDNVNAGDGNWSYGNVSKADVSTWISSVNTADTELTLEGINDMELDINDYGTTKLIVCDKARFKLWYVLACGYYQRQVPPSDPYMAALGWKSIDFQGATIVYDKYLDSYNSTNTTKLMYLLDTDWIYFFFNTYLNPGGKAWVSDPIQSSTRPGRMVRNLWWCGGLIVPCRAAHGRFESLAT